MQSSLTVQEKSFLHDTLEHMKGCKGKSCILPRRHHHHHPQITSNTQDNEDLGNNVNAIPFKGTKRRYGMTINDINLFLVESFFQFSLLYLGNVHLVENETSEIHPKRRQNKYVNLFKLMS